MRSKLLLIILGLIVMITVACTAKYMGSQIQVNEIEIVDYGIYLTVPTGEIIESNVIIAKPSVTKEFIKQTDRIPAIRGYSFGFRFIVKGTPKGEDAEFVLGVFHPALVNPQTGKSFKEQIWKFRYPIGFEETTMLARHSYKFEEDWELVPGEWTLKIWYKDKLLAEKTFTVYKP